MPATFRIDGESFTHKEAAKAYAADVALTVVQAVVPDKTIALPALSLVVPIIGPALAPAALIAGATWDVYEAAASPLRVPVSAAKAAYHAALAVLGR